MPTPTGGETLGERLLRCRAELARVDRTLARHEDNGQSVNLGGTAVTEIAYERALERRESLRREIRDCEAQANGSQARSNVAIAQTRMPS